MLHTHTPGRSRVNPERQEEEKSGHTTGRRPKQRRGGRGTDGPPEPTYTAKRTWQKQRTHLNPTTRYGEARGERLGTNGELVDARQKPKQLIKKQDPVPRPTVRAIVPQQARVPVSHKGIKRLSSSIELGAQHVSPHQTTKRKKTTPERRVPAFSQCLDMISCSCKGCCKKRRFLAVRHGFTWQSAKH